MNPLCSDPGFAPLKAHLIAVTGLAYYADKDDDLAARTAQRLAARHVPDCAAYLALLRDPADAELNALIESVTIGETFFFRHGELFDALRDVAIPDLLARNRAARRLHIWSAGCSVGAETYSLAILLRRHFARALEGWDVNILGTDVNRGFLARARAGYFEEWALRNSDDAFRRKHFVPSGNGRRIADEYRAGVAFQYHNLVTQPFPSFDLCAFDLILCRNVTIYFSPDIVARVVGELHDSLVPGGWLAVGHAEPSTQTYAAFRTVNAHGAVLYQKAPTDSAPPWTPPTVPNVPRVAPAAAPVPGPSVLGAIRAHADRGEWADAERLCQAAQADDRLDPAVYFYQALVMEQTGRHAEAERTLRQALYLDRRWVLAHYHLGLVQQKQGQLAAAARSFANVLKLTAGRDPMRQVAEGDGITLGELERLTRMHLQTLEAA